jgi:hypothetical protein
VATHCGYVSAGHGTVKAHQVVVDARTAARPVTNAARSVFDMGGDANAGAASNDDNDALPPTPQLPPATNAFGSLPRPQENAMPETPSREATPRYQVLAALTASKLSAPEIKAKTTLEDRQIGNALYAAKAAGHVTRDDKGVWHVTKAGRAWLAGSDKFGSKPAAKTSPAEVKSRRRSPTRRGQDLAIDEQQRAGVVHVDGRGRPRASTKPLLEADQQPKAFRCAVFNNGHFFITKAGVDIELTKDEHAEMLQYLDRMGEPRAAVA